MATSTASEDMIFLLDTSASMYRCDGAEANRLAKSIHAIESMITKKVKIDPKDRYSLVLYAKKFAAMNDMVFDATEIMEFITEKAEFEHQTSIGEALTQAIQQVLKQMRFIGQKLFRILILSDGITEVAKVNPVNVAKVAMQLGIVIDVVRFGPAQIPGNILKKLTDMTHGEYFYVSNNNELEQAIDKLAKKKEKKHATIFDKKADGEDILLQEILSEIADSPLKVEEMTEEQKDAAIYNVEKGKKLVCTICYSERCMVDNTSFYGSGRFCPNCLTPFHLPCAIMWSEQQNAKKGGAPKTSTKLFRCTHCFYLLKVPMSDVEKTGNDNLDDNSRILRKLDAKSAKLDNQICNSEDCGSLLYPDDGTIYQCTACNSFFHADCAKSQWSKAKKCPYCQKYVSFEE